MTRSSRPTRFRDACKADRARAITAWILTTLLPVLWAQQSAYEALEIKPGTKLERGLAGGESHEYRFHLNARQFVQFTINQRGLDLSTMVVQPDGQTYGEYDTGWGGVESVSVVVAVAGVYRLRVRALHGARSPAPYDLRIEQARPAEPPDQQRIASERTSTEAKELIRKGTAESLKAAIPKYEEALALWWAIGDLAGEGQVLHTLGFAHSVLGQTQRGLELYERALAVRRSTGDQYGQSETLVNIAAAYSTMGEKGKALDYYNQVLPFKRAAGDRQGEAFTVNNIGMVHYSVSLR